MGRWSWGETVGWEGWAQKVWRRTRRVGGGSSCGVTHLAVVSAFSLRRMPGWDRILRRTVVYPLLYRLWMVVIMASRRCLCGECGLEAGLVISACSICRAVRESVAMLRSGSVSKAMRAWWMATSSARRTVLFSSVPVASIRITVEVAGCITAAHNLGLESLLEPSVYTDF